MFGINGVKPNSETSCGRPTAQNRSVSHTVADLKIPVPLARLCERQLFLPARAATWPRRSSNWQPASSAADFLLPAMAYA